jgi:hypothetical protein
LSLGAQLQNSSPSSGYEQRIPSSRWGTVKEERLEELNRNTLLFIVIATGAVTTGTLVVPIGMTFGFTRLIAFGSIFAATSRVAFVLTVDTALGGAAAANAMIAIATTALGGGRGYERKGKDCAKEQYRKLITFAHDGPLN